MGIYVETIILYLVLFFSGAASAVTGGFVAGGDTEFSAAAELVRIFIYSLPSLTLIWYLLLKEKGLNVWGIRPAKKDLISFLITLPCLLITGFVISFVSVRFGGTPEQIPLRSPGTVLGWAVLSFSCLAAAYLEESFFRFYIISRRKELKLNASGALVLSVALFSVCHIYEGPWGFLNSVISGIILCFIFLRYRALHGIALAHALYNIAAYAIKAVWG